MPQSSSECSLVSTVLSPIRLDSGNLVVQDESGFHNRVDLEELNYTNRELVNLENAAVNIENSTDVIIGPVTRLNVNGNVTIYQNGQENGDAANRSGETNDAQGGRNNGLKFQARNITKRIAANKRCLYKLAAVSFVVALVIAATIIYLCSSDSSDNSDPDDGPVERPYGYFGDYLGSHRIHYKEDWSGLGPVEHNNLTAPVKVAIVTDTFTTTCNTTGSCYKLLNSLLQTCIDRLFSDTGSNFFIGGNGDIYVDIGWTAASEFLRINYAVNFIGNFNKDELNEGMIEAARLLLEKGLELGKLGQDYILVGHNQTSKRFPDRPGENIVKVIQDWPHYSSRILYKT